MQDTPHASQLTILSPFPIADRRTRASVDESRRITPLDRVFDLMQGWGSQAPETDLDSVAAASRD